MVVRRSMDAVDWANAKEPRGPRPVCDLLLERLGTCLQETSALLPGGRGRSGETLSASALLVEVARGVQRALLGSVEQQAFGRQGLQQVQVDVAYLDVQLKRCVRVTIVALRTTCTGCFRICSQHWWVGGSGCWRRRAREQRGGCCLKQWW